VYELIEIHVSPRGGGKGEHLAAALNAERRAEHWTGRGVLFGWIVVVASLALADLAFRGGLESLGARLVIALWALALVALVGCVMARQQARRLFDALVGQIGGRRIHIDD
jgi:hypothetical protein